MQEDGKAATVVLSSVTRRFRERLALADVSLTIGAGEVFGLLGPNGAGKTTTVRLILGILAPTSGRIEVLGLDPVRDGAQMRARCGVVLDQVGLYERLTAEQNLEFAARLGRLTAAERRRRVEEALHRVALWDRRKDRVASFSKGMRQKLALARALLTDPELLILDEPTSGLDPENIVLLREMLLDLAQEGHRTILLCTHHLDEAERLCDRVAILDRGRVRAVGAPRDLTRRKGVAVRCTLTRTDGAERRPDRVLAPLGSEVMVTALGDGVWRVELPDTQAVEDVVARLVAAGIGVRAVVPEQERLEEAYLRLLRDGADAEGAGGVA